jgi:hypothetical protein
MAKIRFTPQLARFIETPVGAVAGGTVGEVLEKVFAENPRLRSYILDDQGLLRKHVALFIDGDLNRGQRIAHIEISNEADLQFWQALSGG